MYDGYYIYSPTYAEVLIEDEQVIKDIDGKNITVQTEKSKVPGERDKDGNIIELEPGETAEKDANGNTITISRDHLLKPYIYYTTRYVVGNNTDFIVNYTLDNYMIIYGNVDGEYVTKSGFLSSPEKIEVHIDKEKLNAILARKILNYLLPTRAVDNMDQQTILDTYKTVDLSPLKDIISEKDTTTGETKSTTAEVALANTIGKTLYEAMIGESRSISAMNDNDIIEALFDSIINEKCDVDRNITEEILARQILSYIPGINAEAGSQAAIISAFKYVFGDVADLETFMNKNVESMGERESRTVEVRNILGGFNKNNFEVVNSLDELLNILTQNIEDPNIANENRNNIKDGIKTTTGVALVEEMLSNKSLSKLSDDELFKLVN